MVLVADDDMVNQFNLQQLTCADDVTSHLDVSFRRRAFSRYAAYGISGVIPHSVLCRMVGDSSWFSFEEQPSDTA